jgi:UDP-N-acetyl-D-mannosaminuronic acid dehydrogenase
MGYIGLPTALHYVKNGINVIGIDIDEKLIADLKEGKISMVEEGLDELAAKYLKKIPLGTSYDLTLESDICVLCLPSPIDENRNPDLSYLEDAIKQLAKTRQRETLFLIESTVPIGTTENLARLYGEISGLELDTNFWFVHSPERVLPGSVVEEMETNHRLVGGVSKSSTELATAFLNTIFKSEQVHPTTSKVSEAAKLAENAFRDVNIAYANELAKICNESSIDVIDVIRFANLHPRVSILRPGLGVGGYCLPKDGWLLVDDLDERADIAQLIPAARGINDSMPEYVFSKIKRIVQETKDSKPSVCLLGLSYKPNVGDTRNSPSLELLELLENSGYRTVLFDPLVTLDTKAEVVSNLDEAVESCNYLVIGTGHKMILSALEKLNLSEKTLFDPWTLVGDLAKKVRRYVGLTIEEG